MSKQQEAQQLLDDLDSFTPRRPAVSKGGSTISKSGASAAVAGNEKDAAEALAFLDEMTRKSSDTRRTTPGPPPPVAPVTRVTLGGANRPGTPGTLSRKSGESARASPKPDGSTLAPPQSSTTEASASTGSGGSWGWGSVWNTASSAIQQARTVVDEQVKNLPQNDQAKKWREGVMGYVKQAQLDKLGNDLRNTSLSGLVSGILNAVAPPIAEHEVIQVCVSHDMEGYDGVESIVYNSMHKILQQVEGGDLVVNKGNESRPKDSSSDGKRELHAVEELDAAMKLAEAEVEQLVKSDAAAPPKEQSTLENPTTYSSIYLRIQPFTTSVSSQSEEEEEEEEESADNESSDESSDSSKLQFLLYLSDPSHSLIHTSITQSVPHKWFELWDAEERKGGLLDSLKRRNGEWIEDMVVEVLRLGVEVVGQEYLVARMGWDRENDEQEETSEKPIEKS